MGRTPPANSAWNSRERLPYRGTIHRFAGILRGLAVRSNGTLGDHGRFLHRAESQSDRRWPAQREPPSGQPVGAGSSNPGLGASFLADSAAAETERVLRRTVESRIGSGKRGPAKQY